MWVLIDNIKPGKPVVGTYPNKSKCVLADGADHIVGQSVRCGEKRQHAFIRISVNTVVRAYKLLSCRSLKQTRNSGYSGQSGRGNILIILIVLEKTDTEGTSGPDPPTRVLGNHADFEVLVEFVFFPCHPCAPVRRIQAGRRTDIQGAFIFGDNTKYLRRQIVVMP